MINPKKSFGEELRVARRRADKTLGELARHLEMPIVHLSAIERGLRKPLRDEQILDIGKLLQTDAMRLLEAAKNESGFVEYDIRTAGALEAKVVTTLVNGLVAGKIDHGTLQTIDELLEKRVATRETVPADSDKP